ncbi:hypothetical protein, partial [Gimesia sp.]|uniref:hypothetical protein n=1 Tax=Gimesia sp. TaxID=2024833 RepID=UPI003A8E5C8D
MSLSIRNGLLRYALMIASSTEPFREPPCHKTPQNVPQMGSSGAVQIKQMPLSYRVTTQRQSNK